MKPIEVKATKTNFNGYLAVFCLIVLFHSCSVEKNNYKIVKQQTQDTLIQQPSYGSIKSMGKMKNTDKNALLFDQFIANDFHLPKKKRDSAAIVNYFRKASFAQLGRKEFQQWDLVVIRGILFQVNVEKNPYEGKYQFKK